jgi:hypothetical protein
MKLPTVLLALLLPLSLPAAVVLTVDVSDRSAVTVTATEGKSLISDESVSSLGGIQLFNFFETESQNFNISDTGGNSSLRTWIEGTPPGDGFADRAFVDGRMVGGREALLLYTSGSDDPTWDLTNGEQAFQGRVTFDLDNPLVGTLPGIGSTGDIKITYTDPAEGVVGTWQAIPEPSSYGVIFGLVGLAFAVTRRRRRSILVS